MTQTTTAETPMAQDDSYVSWREFLAGGHSAALALVCLAIWLHAANNLIVATMLPAMVAEVGGVAYVNWSLSIYQIGSIVAGAGTALTTMRYGLRLPMSIAAALFGLGSLLAALAPNMALILIGRALQGWGGGGLVAMAFVAVGMLFPRRHAARAFAVLSTFWGVSAFLGPLLGGLAVEYANWRWGFGIFAIKALFLALWILRRTGIDAPAGSSVLHRFPLTRLAILALAVILISAGGVRVELGRSSALIGAGLLALGWFFWRDRRAGADRLLPAATLDLRSPTGGAMIMLFTMSSATVGIMAYGPFLMSMLHGISALSAGYVIACSSVGWSVAAFAVSGAPERLDRVWITLGMIVTALSLPGFAYALPAGPVWLIALCAIFEGAGFGLAWTFVLRRITALVPQDEVQRVSAAMPTIQRLGYALGAAFLGVLANASGFLEIDGPQDAAVVSRVIFLAFVPVALVGLVAMVPLVRKQPYDR